MMWGWPVMPLGILRVMLRQVIETDSVSSSSLGHNGHVNLKMNKRTANVYENKGSQWKVPGRAGNVIENKATYR